MTKEKKPLNKSATEVDRLFMSQKWAWDYTPEAVAENTRNLDLLLKNVLQGTRHCGTRPNVQNLVKSLDYAKCFLTAAEYFQKHIARAEAEGDPPAALAELEQSNTDSVDRAAKRWQEARTLWQEIKEKEFSVVVDLGR